MVAVETRAADNTEEDEKEVVVEEKQEEEEEEKVEGGRQGVASRTGGDVEAVRLRGGRWWYPEQCGKGESVTREEEKVE